jgi:L-lactate permease
MSDLELISGVSAIPIILGLVKLARMIGLKEKYAPLLTVALGELASITYYFYSNQTWYEAVIVGLILGLSAIGLYSGTRETMEAFRKPKKS